MIVASFVRNSPSSPNSDVGRWPRLAIDQALTVAWDPVIGQEADDIALVAVSGYGHGERHHHSDIDNLILLHNESGKHHRRAIEQFLTLLWDCNLKVGPSVRTIAECAVEGAAGLTITL